MSDAVKNKKPSTYQDLLDLPETVVGEIIDGELVVSPRPSGLHGVAASDKVSAEPFETIEIDLSTLWGD